MKENIELYLGMFLVGSLFLCLAGALFNILWESIKYFIRKKNVFNSKIDDRLQLYAEQHMIRFSDVTKKFLLELEVIFKEKIKEDPTREVLIPIKFETERCLPVLCNYVNSTFHDSHVWISCGEVYKEDLIDIIKNQGLTVKEIESTDNSSYYAVVIFNPNKNVELIRLI